MATADDAVRAYLRHSRDPDAVAVDTAELDDKINASDDPLERLALQNARIEASKPGPRLEADFITHARAWADDHHVSAQAFLAEGVDAAVLTKAGLLPGRGTRTPRRSRRVSTEEIRKAVTGRRKPFTIKDIQDASRGSAGTVRKVVTEMIDAGTLTQLGPDPDHAGPGRAPTLYRKA